MSSTDPPEYIPSYADMQQWLASVTSDDIDREPEFEVADWLHQPKQRFMEDLPESERAAAQARIDAQLREVRGE